MTTRAGSRLLVLGTLWGLLLVAVPALLMTNPYRLSSLLVASLVCAELSGCVGTLAAGRRAARSGGRSGLLAGIGTGASQGLVGGVVLGPVFGTLVNRAVRAGSVAGGKDAGDDAAGKKDLVVR